MAEKKTKQSTTITRPPIIVVMGHIDHGKSTLLDYIRKTNIVEGEAGGITQHLSAYEVVHKDEKGADRKITFLDTPGHAAFQKMRLRGAEVADIAILIISAEEGVKAQTLEAYKSIKEAKLSFVVAINKIDQPNADIEKTKQSLVEHEIYLEGYGGDVPWVPISAKVGTGVPELLDIMLLVADMQELTADPKKPAQGIVIETKRDPRKGISATLIITDGTLQSGTFLASGGALSPVRIFEDFLGSSIKEASFSTPVRVVGWSNLPEVGSSFHSFKTKKEAEQALAIKDSGTIEPTEVLKEMVKESGEEEEEVVVIPIVLRADAAGSLDAIEHELKKLESERVTIRIVSKGVGAVSEGDVKAASGVLGTLVIGFHTLVDRSANDLAKRNGVELNTFDIIYKLSEWFESVIKERTPQGEEKITLSRAKILKCFSRTKNKQVVGGRVEEGVLEVKQSFRILRNDIEIGTGGVIENLQQQKADTKNASEGSEFGAQLKSEIEIIAGDIIEAHQPLKK